ncbi:MAG TPA: hypothetical protein VFF81_00190 [Noviherbaspirillum sp.]|nr:hypothetical protein [Noviherbaspirillum sp.]
MESFRPGFLIVLLAGLLATSDSLAHRGSTHRHARVGVTIGIPWGAPWPHPAWPYPNSYPDYYYPYTYSYSYPPVVVLPSPPVYIEQNAAPPLNGQQGGNWWYYCPSSRAYYPYVTECPQGWQLVPPQPPDLR